MHEQCDDFCCCYACTLRGMARHDKFTIKKATSSSLLSMQLFYALFIFICAISIDNKCDLLPFENVIKYAQKFCFLLYKVLVDI